MNNLLILSCKWDINTFKNLPIIVLIKIKVMPNLILFRFTTKIRNPNVG